MVVAVIRNKQPGAAAGDVSPVAGEVQRDDDVLNCNYVRPKVALSTLFPGDWPLLPRQQPALTALWLQTFLAQYVPRRPARTLPAVLPATKDPSTFRARSCAPARSPAFPGPLRLRPWLCPPRTFLRDIPLRFRPALTLPISSCSNKSG